MLVAKHGSIKNGIIVALPPVIAEVITSIYESFLCTFLIEGKEGRYGSYHDVMLYVWVAATVCILASFFVAIFVKENKVSNIYKVKKYTETVEKSSDWWVVILVCIAGAAVMFVRWCTAGPTATSQLIFMGHKTGVDTRFYEGYLTMLYAIGQLIGTIIAGVWLNKSKNKKHPEKIWLIVIAAVIWTIYLIITAQYANVPVFFMLNFINGLALGLVWASMIGMMMSKSFSKTKYLTPVGLFNTFLSVGICLGTFYNNWVKGTFFDFQSWDTKGHTYEDFVRVNRNVNAVCLIVTIALVIFMIIAYIIHNKFPPKMKKVNQLHVINETEV